MCKGHRASQLRLFQDLELLLTQLGSDIGAASTLFDLFENNMPLLIRIEPSVVATMAQLSIQFRKPRYISFLIVMCSANGVPIPRNQRKVFEACFKNLDESVLANCTVHGDKLMLGLPGTPQIDVSHFRGKGDEIMHAEEKSLSPEDLMFRYHHHTLDLLYHLCQGRNRECIEYILKNDMLPSYTELLRIVMMNIPAFLKRAYMRLLMRLYVDREPFAPQPGRVVLGLGASKLGPEVTQPRNPNPTPNPMPIL